LLPWFGLSAVPAAAADATTPPAATHRARLAVTIDFLDVVAEAGRPLVAADIDAMMANIAGMGIQRVYFRVDMTGLLHYPTKVGQPYRDDGRHPLALNTLQTHLNLGDALRVNAEAAKRYGLQFFVWYPIRDQGATELGYNPYDPEEGKTCERVGRRPSLNPLFAANPQFSLERREGEVELTQANVPVITRVVMRTTNPQMSVSKEDVCFWTSWDSLRYEPVPDTWQITPSTHGAETWYEFTGLRIQAPWVKVAQRQFGKWQFAAGEIADPWLVFHAEDGTALKTTWWLLWGGDKNPATGEARSPVATDEWPIWKYINFGPRGDSVVVFTSDMPPFRYLQGSPCFAYPEVRDYFVRLTAEMASYPMDGLLVSIRTHSRSRLGLGIHYGFNPPIVAEYQKRYGVDILHQDFDRQKWVQIQSEFYTQTLRQIREVLKAKDKQLIAMFEPEPDPTQPFGDTPLLQDQIRNGRPSMEVGRCDLEWQAWVDQGIVDGVMVFTTGAKRRHDAAEAHAIADIRARVPTTQLSYFYLWDNPKRDDFYTFMTQALGDRNVDEVLLYEYVCFAFPEPERQVNNRAVLLELRAGNH
jgi:hypothetical protein